MDIKILKDRKKHNWKKLSKKIVKGTSYEFLGDFEYNFPNLTVYYCYEKQTNKPIGYISLGFTTEYHNFYGIEFIGILPEYRNKGIASKLLNFAKKQAKKEGFDRLFVAYCSNEKNVGKFNQKHGFVYENTYVNIKLDTGKKLYFCPFSYYDNKLKHRSTIINSFEIMYLRL